MNLGQIANYRSGFLNVDPKDLKRGDVIKFKLEKEVVGSEQAGDRYGIIIQNNIGNYHSPTIIVAMTTSRMCKNFLPTHVILKGKYITPQEGLNNIPKPIMGYSFDGQSIILCEQLRTIDKRRIMFKVGSINNKDILEKINNALKISLSL